MVNDKSAHATNDQANRDKPKPPERRPAASSLSTQVKESDSRENANYFNLSQQDLYPCFHHQHYHRFLELETGKLISAPAHANQEISDFSTGQPVLPPIGSRNGS